MKKKVLYEISILFIFISVILFALFLFNVSIVKELNKKKIELLDALQAKTGYSIDYKKISPYIFGSLKIHEVILQDESIRLELGNIKVNYSFFSYIFNKDRNYLLLIDKIELNSFNLNTDKNKINNLIDKFKTKNIDNKKKALNKKIIFAIKKGKLNINDGLMDYNINLNNFRLLLSKDIDLKSSFDLNILKDKISLFTTTIETGGKLKRNKDLFNSKFFINILNTDIITNKLKIQRFIFESSNKDFLFYRLNDKLPIKISISKKNEILSADIDITELDVKEIFKKKEKALVLPDHFTLKTVLNYNIQTKNKDGFFKLNSFHNKFLFLKNLSLDIGLKINDNIIDFEKFIVKNLTDNNFINMNGTLALDDSNFSLKILFNDFILPFNKINTTININRINNVFSFFFNDLLINDKSIGGFHLIAEKKTDDYIIRTIKNFNGYDITGRIFKNKNLFNYNIVHNFNNFSLTNIISLYTETKSNLFLSGKIINNFSDNMISIDENSKFDIFDNNKKIFSYNVEMLNKILNIKSNTIADNKNKMNISYDFSKKPFVFIINFENKIVKYDILFFNENKNLFLNINNAFSANYKILENKIYVKAKNFSVLKDHKVMLNTNFVYNMNNNSINESEILIRNIRLFNKKYGFLRTYISMNNNILSLKKVIFNDGKSNIQGDLNVDFSQTDKIVGKAFLKDINKDESLSMDFNIIDKILTSKIFITHFNLNNISDKFSGYADIRLNTAGKILNPDINMDMDISKAKYADKNLDLIFIMQKKSNEITIKKALIQLGLTRININKSTINLSGNNSNKVEINGNLLLEGLQKIFKTNFLITGNFDFIKNKNTLLNLDILFNSISLGYFEGYDLKKVEKFFDKKFNILKNENIIQLTNYGAKFVFAEIMDNILKINFFKNGNQVFDFIFNLKEKNDITMVFSRFPVNVIQKILNPFVGIDDGFLEGNLIIKDPVLKPLFFGNINLIFGTVSLPDYLPDPIVNISGIITAEKNRILVKNVNAQVKKGLAHGYGEILFNNWKLERYEFHLNSDTVPAIIKKGPIDAKGSGYIKDFTFEGKPKNYNFIADLFINQADINLESLIGLNNNNKMKKFPINVFIKFTTGDRIRIMHPIISGTIAPNEVFLLKFSGNDAAIYLGGKFNLRKGEVNYINKIFKIESAEFQFFENEERINPNLNLKAYYRTKDNRKDNVKLYITMNDRLFPFKTKFYTIPPRTNEEISSLLGLPIPEQSTDNKNEVITSIDKRKNINPVSETTDYISDSLLFNPIENKIRKITGLDVFTLNTKIFGNILKSNIDYTKSTYDLLDETSITIGKYLVNELYFESLLSFNKKKIYSDQFFLPIADHNYGLNLQFMLQLEFPYFSVGYTFSPKEYFNFIKSDHKISLETNINF